MNVTEIIDLAREEVLDDTKVPYLWKTTGLIFFLNEALNEFCRETWIITDQTTAAVTQIKLLSNLGIYPLDERVLNIKSARFLNTNDGTWPLSKKSEAYLDASYSNWRATTGTPKAYCPDAEAKSLSIYPKYDTDGEVIGASNITFTAATKKISKPGASFTTAFPIGTEFRVSGTTSNDGYFTVANVADTEITVNEVLVNEGPVSAVLRKVRNTLLMVVNRLPLTSLTPADYGAVVPVVPEIKSLYHGGLIYGIGKFAFAKPDTDTFDKARSEQYRVLFELVKARAKADVLRLQAYDQTNPARLGNT